MSTGKRTLGRSPDGALLMIPRFYTFSGRQPSSLAQFELTTRELDEIVSGTDDAFAESVVSLYHLCLFDVSDDFYSSCKMHKG